MHLPQSKPGQIIEKGVHMCGIQTKIQTVASQKNIQTAVASQKPPNTIDMLQREVCLNGERAHEDRGSSEYPSVPLLCFPMSQSIFIPLPRSPLDLLCRSLLIPSASSLWSHYKPHIYLMIELPACLPRLCVLYSHVCVCECITWHWPGKTSECKISLVTYSVSCLPKRPVRQMGWGCSLCCAPFQHTQLKQAPGALRGLWVLMSFFFASTVVIYRPCCYFALCLGFSLLSFTGSV